MGLRSLKTTLALVLVLLAGVVTAVEAPGAEAAITQCVPHNPGYSSLDTQIRCNFQGTFSANGYYWYEDGYYVSGKTYLSGWYVISGFRKLWWWDGASWRFSTCQGYDAASGQWFPRSC
jgi:hypothetical protein